MADTLYITIPLFIDDINDNAVLQKSIAKAIMDNQNDFLPLLERLIDMGNARDMSVAERSLNIEDCDIDVDNTKGVACGMFDSNYFASCKDVESVDEHEVTLPFTIENDNLVFDFQLPPAWIPD